MSHEKEEAPVFRAPPLSCDAHFHVFGRPGQYAYGKDIRYTPPHAPLEDFLGLARHLGIERTVFVQPSAYGRNNDCMLDFLTPGWLTQELLPVMKQLKRRSWWTTRSGCSASEPVSRRIQIVIRDW